MHTNSRLLFAKYGRQFIHPGARVLEIGPEAVPSAYNKVVDDVTVHWDTLDIIEREGLTYPRAGEYSFPIQEDTYDVVVTGQVIEHVKKIWLWVRELGRVCKTGGYVIIINPVSWPFHEVPVDCWRIYPDGMRALLEDTALRVIDSRFESLEVPGYQHYMPGKSPEFRSLPLRLFYRIAGRLGFWVERSYDTITIAQKK